ncbi:MAG: hypothetical protein WC608_00325 [Parcubacteria group bacterium]
MIKKILLNRTVEINNLASNIIYAFTELAKDDGNSLFSRIEDPANSKNILSDLMTQSEKNEIIAASKIALQSDWEQVFY